MDIVHFLDTWQTALTTLAGIAVTVGFLWGKFLGPISKLLEAQLRANGGGSLVDKVDKIAENHADAEAHWTKLESGQKELTTAVDGRIDGLIRRVERLEAYLIEGTRGA